MGVLLPSVLYKLYLWSLGHRARHYMVTGGQSSVHDCMTPPSEDKQDKVTFKITYPTDNKLIKIWHIHFFSYKNVK